MFHLQGLHLQEELREKKEKIKIDINLVEEEDIIFLDYNRSMMHEQKLQENYRMDDKKHRSEVKTLVDKFFDSIEDKKEEIVDKVSGTKKTSTLRL